MNGWTFNTLGSAVSGIAITQGIQQALFVTLFDNCLVYDYNPTTTTYALGIYNLLFASARALRIIITTPNEDGPINMLAEGSTLYFGYGSYAGDIPGGQIYSTTALNTHFFILGRQDFSPSR